MKKFVGVVAVFVGMSVAALAAQDAKKIEAGQQAYATLKCGSCHSIKTVGGKSASALDGVGKKLTEADIRKWLVSPAEMEAKLKTKPKVTMSGFMKSRKMTDADVDALVAYMLSLK